VQCIRVRQVRDRLTDPVAVDDGVRVIGIQKVHGSILA
jgi:hypothetical protein